MEQEKKNIEILKDPCLLDRCIEEIQKKVVGERETLLTLLICAHGKNVINHNLASYNLLINDESGLGKDFVTASVCELLPEKHYVFRTKITPEVFTYWHNPYFEPEWTWDDKVFYLEDVPEKIINSEVFKVMASRGSKATVLINQTPVEIEIKGKPVIFITSAKANPNEESLRRFPIINLDESDEQTYKIMKRKGEKAKTEVTMNYDFDLQNALSCLVRVNVVVPYADILADFFPKNRFMRTHFERFLDYIKASASFHQYQREKSNNRCIIASGEDYDVARIMLLKTTSNPSMIPLTKDQQKIMDFFIENPNQWFAVNDMEDKFPFSDRWLRKLLDHLFSLGFLGKDKQQREGIVKKVVIYCFKEDENSVKIPTWQEIFSEGSKASKEGQFEQIEQIEQNLHDDKKSVQKVQVVQKQPLLDRIKEVKEYIKKIEEKGFHASLTAILDNFDKNDVSHLIKDGFMVKIPGSENYTWQE